MWIAPLVGYLATLFVSLCGVQYHINVFRYPAYLLVPLTLAVFLPLLIVVLLPLDYVSHNRGGGGDDAALPDRVILALWKSNYWSTFALTWVILPTLQEYYRLGHFRAWARLADALRRTLRYQAIVLGCLVAGLVYLLLEVGLTVQHVKLMIIAATHVYLLVVALWLMAHGLVSIPRNRWTAGSNTGNLRHFYLQLPAKVDLLEDTRILLKEDVLKVLVLAQNFTAPTAENLRYRDWILRLSLRVPAAMRDAVRRQVAAEHHIARDQLSDAFMVRLTASFNQNKARFVGYESDVRGLLDKIIELEDVTGASGVAGLRLPPRRWLALSPRQRRAYLCHVSPVLNRLCAVALAAALVVIFESELLHLTRLSLMDALVGARALAWARHAATTLTFLYMLFASLNSLTRLKIFNVYHLVPHKLDPVLACFYATYIARLTLPLSYNFITLFVSRALVFEDWFGALIVLDRAGIFNLLNNWLPRLLLVPVVLTVFNVYERVQQRLGLTSELYDAWVFDDDEAGPASTHKRTDLIVAEAKRIVNREWLRRQHQLQAPLRAFNLAHANHDANVEFTEALANRIEFEPDAPAQAGVLDRLGGAWAGVRDTVVSRWGGNNVRSYRDDPDLDDRDLDGFDYDRDNMVL